MHKQPKRPKKHRRPSRKKQKIDPRFHQFRKQLKHRIKQLRLLGKKQKVHLRFYPLLHAVRTDLDEAESLVAADPSIVNAKRIDETIFHYLVVENDLKAVEWLRRHGSLIDTQNNFGETPLMDAAQLGYLKMCRYLVRHGANPRYINNSNPCATTSVFSDTAQNGKTKILKYLLTLIEPKEDINCFFSDSETLDIRDHSPASFIILVARGLRTNVEWSWNK